MKILIVIFFVLILGACESKFPPANYRQFIILSDRQFKVGNDVADLSPSIANIEPDKSKQVDIIICPKVDYKVILKVVETLKASGFNRIGIATDGDRDQKLQALCANFAIKGTSV